MKAIYIIRPMIIFAIPFASLIFAKIFMLFSEMIFDFTFVEIDVDIRMVFCAIILVLGAISTAIYGYHILDWLKIKQEKDMMSDYDE